MVNNKKGYCVYYFAHRGIGRQIIPTDDMIKTKNNLLKDRSGDILYVVCDKDKNKAINKYNILSKKSKKKRKKKEVIKKSLRTSKRKKLSKKKKLSKRKSLFFGLTKYL